MYTAWHCPNTIYFHEQEDKKLVFLFWDVTACNLVDLRAFRGRKLAAAIFRVEGCSVVTHEYRSQPRPNKFRGLSPGVNYTDRATATGRQSYCQICG
jgi:hypothetical protein